MTTNELLNLARNILLETTTDIISDANLLLFANESYKDVYKRTFSMTDVETATVVMTAGVGTLPSTFGTMYGDAVDGSDNFYPEVPIEDFHREQMERMVTNESLGDILHRCIYRSWNWCFIWCGFTGRWPGQ